MSMPLTASIFIQASCERVFEILTDFPHYPDWNSVITKVEATGNNDLSARVDNVVSVTSNEAYGQDSIFQQTITQLDSPHIFTWCYTGYFGSIQAERIRELRPNQTGCIYTVTLKITGITASVGLYKYGDSLQAGLIAEATDLKEFAEQAKV